jgi:hypothetical protein
MYVLEKHALSIVVAEMLGYANAVTLRRVSSDDRREIEPLEREGGRER